ncbi:M1 family metallopeptidase [Pedobacter sp. AW31-3R]|uniref:M1 family metallopeptidase n=1 Tax=Pedobacter sp. AW31-3R TaxID=3445781 RepID=UPI003FA10C3D
MKISAIRIIFLISISFSFSAKAQSKTEKTNELIHTKLDVRFDYKNRYLYGKEWVTIKPYLHPSDSVKLDAKGMDIHSVSLFKNGKDIPLKYRYDQRTLTVKLDKVYQPAENYTIYIDYTSKPDQLKLKPGTIITDDKGLFFINPDSTLISKPVQIWTQSALENASVWFPTIDHPNQKTTQEISMTVPAKYVTLSNGRLAAQLNNPDGTRTDTWKMELPHAPYLFMMAVGDFKVYRDHWRGKEVNYYLEPAYAPYAKAIFGDTPEMMDFFSRTLGVDYPWNKYAQVVVRDFVSGGMENTTATLLINHVQATARELKDHYYDAGRSLIAHELFHQWFGDYVTAKDWSNITLNESFADFGETLWAEYKYGKDEGDAHNREGMQEYLTDPESAKKDLVRVNYEDAQEVFDVVSYQKGGRVLNMLRNDLGAQVFFKGLNSYLKTNAFKNADVHALQSAMEQASGKKLDWFFDQWYYGAGHPLLDISYQWEEKSKTQRVFLQQKQAGKAFILPIAIEVYGENKKERRQLVMRNKLDTLRIKMDKRPFLVNVDADKVLLAEKSDRKSLQEFYQQFRRAPLYMDRFEAIEAAIKKRKEVLAQRIMIDALQDKYYGLRIKTLEGLDTGLMASNPAVLPLVVKLAKTDSNNLVRATAIRVLSDAPVSKHYLSLYQQGLKSDSYAIAAASLKAFSVWKPAEAFAMAKSMEKDAGGDLTAAVIAVYAKSGGDAEWPFVFKKFVAADPHVKFPMLNDVVLMISKMQTAVYVREGITMLKDFALEFKTRGMAPPLIEALQQIKQLREQRNDQVSKVLVDEAIEQINN